MNWNDDIRAMFPVTSACTYFDVAYDCGGCTLGRQSAAKYFDDWVVSAAQNERGGPGRGVFFRHLGEARVLINQLIGGVGPQQVAFTRNTNEGMNAILQGFDFKPGDNIITGDYEHQSVLMPALNLKKTKGVEVRIFPGREDLSIYPEDLIALADEHTRIIAVSHVQSATGFCLDLKTLGAWCRAHGVFLLVDAIQSLGQKPFFAEEWGVDMVTASSYKGLCGEESSGFVYAVPALLEHVWPVYTAAGFVMGIDRSGDPQIDCDSPGSARKLENSSLDNLGGYIIYDAVKMLLDTGIDRIWEHINRLYHRLYDGFKALGYQVLSFEDDDKHAASLLLGGPDLEALFAFFRERNIALTYGHGFMRISVGIFNNDDDVDILLQAAADFMNRQ